MGKSSGYGGWESTSDGKEVNSKTESHDDGSSTEHHLWNNSGDGYGRENHNHVVIEKDESGHITYAHSSGEKYSRNDPDMNEDRILSWNKDEESGGDSGK